MLKEEVRNMERMQKREGVDMTYLKNVILKLLETGTYLTCLTMETKRLKIKSFTILLFSFHP